MATTGDGDGGALVRDVGRRISEVRAAKGWTQERFAEALGIELRNVQRLESGRANVTLSTLGRVAAKLGVRPAELLEPPVSLAAARGRPRRKNRAEDAASASAGAPSNPAGELSVVEVPAIFAEKGRGIADRATDPPHDDSTTSAEQSSVGTHPPKR